MIRFLTVRIATMVGVVFIVSIGLFLLSHAAPGGPIAALIPPDQLGASAELIKAKEHEFGLDQPLLTQYATWLTKVLHGDLGSSFQFRRPVSGLLLERAVPTLELMLLGLIVGNVVAVVLGMYSASRKGRASDYLVGFGSLFFLSIPAFFLGMLGIYVFGAKLHWLPTAGMNTVGDGSLVDLLRHLILPAGVLAVVQAASMTRYVRVGLIEELQKDYVRTSIAKGATRAQARLKAFRNTLLPIVTLMMISVPSLLAGAIVLEAVFAWPGMGQLTLTAVQNRDYPVILGFGLIVAVLVVISNFVADLLMRVLDPRVRLS